MFPSKSGYEVLKEHSLIIEFHSGILELNSYIDFKTNLTLHPDYSSNLNLFVHLKNVTFEGGEKDLKTYINFFEKDHRTLGEKQVALITNTPNQVVYSTLYRMMQKNDLQTIEIFSTNKSAMKWLKTPNLPIKEVLNILDKLKNK